MSHDGRGCVWATGDWSHLRTLTGHTGYVESCACAPDGGTLVTVSEGGTARMWAFGIGPTAQTLTKRTGYVVS